MLLKMLNKYTNLSSNSLDYIAIECVFLVVCLCFFSSISCFYDYQVKFIENKNAIDRIHSMSENRDIFFEVRSNSSWIL